jgi:hypothetical protein
MESGARSGNRFTRFWAELSIGFGYLLMTLGVLIGGVGLFLMAASYPVPDIPFLTRVGFLGAALLSMGLGVILGGPFIVAGQCLLVFLEQRRLLARIAKRLRSLERG